MLEVIFVRTDCIAGAEAKLFHTFCMIPQTVSDNAAQELCHPAFCIFMYLLEQPRSDLCNNELSTKCNYGIKKYKYNHCFVSFNKDCVLI